MKSLLVLSAALAAACGAQTSPSTPQVLELERWSPPQASAHDILLATRGDVVVLQKRISRDGGATWSPLDSRIGELKGVAITGQQMTLYGTSTKLARYDLVTSSMTPLSNVPAFTGERTWRVDPAGDLLVFDAVENKLSVEHAGTWSQAALPQPSPTEVRPYIKDLESNGSTVLAVSAWGVHRSLDGGKTFTYVAAANDARDILVLADRRFALVGNGDAQLFDASGAAAGTSAGLRLGENEATVCEDGAIVARNKVSHDLGATWQPLTVGGDLSVQVTRSGCASGGYWVLALSDIWGYRLIRYDTLGGEGYAAGNWDALGDQAWSNGGPAIARAPDGTFLVAGYALAPGATEWTQRETPSRTWTSDDVLFGVQDKRFYMSPDGGMNWEAAVAAGLTIDEPEAFARSFDGKIFVSQFSGKTEGETDTWRSVVWQSGDSGSSWTIAYDGIATRAGDDKIVGEAHRFVGVTEEGTWIATDAISHDSGTTWQRTDVKGDRGLAHLTPGGALVTGGADEKLWRVYDEGGLGELRATYQIEVEGNPIPASQLRSVAFDDDGYAYIARGMPYVQIWRSSIPLDRSDD
jgi:hypothetical protein